MTRCRGPRDPLVPASEVVRRRFRREDVVHYKQWFQLVVADGHWIGGKNATATRLTVARSSGAGRRSGLYKLVAA